MRIFHYILGTALGSGYAPFAPGTAGSLLALMLFWFLPMPTAYRLACIALLFFAGVWSAGLIEREQGKDPQIVVIDELVGQWIALLFIPHQWAWFGASFLLFRLFDIFKPWPVYQSQNLPGGWGIMIDDVLAGIYANLFIQLILISGFLS